MTGHSVTAAEGEFLSFLDHSASDSASVQSIVSRFGRDSLSIAESLADRGYIDRLYGGGYRLQARGRQAAMEYRLLKKQSDEQRAREERDKHIEEQHLAERDESRVAAEHMHAYELQASDHEFQFKLHKSAQTNLWIQWAINAAVAIGGVLAGAILEYRTDFIDSLIALFH